MHSILTQLRQLNRPRFKLPLMLLLAIIVSIWLHTFQNFTDRRIQALLKETLFQGKVVRLGDVISRKKTVCVLPGYNDADFIRSFLLAQQADFVNLKINGTIG